MTEDRDYNFFLHIGSNEIKFESLDLKNKISFSRKSFLNNYKENSNFELVENFLEKNIIDIEKNIKDYVKDINLVLDHKDFLFVNLSIKCNLDITKFDQNRLNNLLIDCRNQFKNTIGNFEIIHMVISKFMADGNNYTSLSEIKNHDKICLEIKFICLSKSIIKNLKNILSKYQILTKNILCLSYLKEFEYFSNNESSLIALKVLHGLNANEIFYKIKSVKNKSFFEKFFSYFN